MRCVTAIVIHRQIPTVQAPTAATNNQISCAWAVACFCVATTKASERSWEVSVKCPPVAEYKSSCCYFYWPIPCLLISTCSKTWIEQILKVDFLWLTAFNLVERQNIHFISEKSLWDRHISLDMFKGTLPPYCSWYHLSNSVFLILYSFHSILFASILSDYLQGSISRAYSNCFLAA